MDYTPTRLERETVITFNEQEPDAEIYTTSPIMMRKLAKLTAKSDVLRVVHEDSISKAYSCPKKMIKVHLPRLLGQKKDESGHSGEVNHA